MAKNVPRGELAPGAMILAAAVADPEDPATLRLVAASLAPGREAAEADLAEFLADWPAGSGTLLKIPYGYALDRLPELPLIRGRKE